jgi:DNA-binding phage protein
MMAGACITQLCQRQKSYFYLEEIKMGKIRISKKRQRSLARSTKLDLAKVPGLTRAQPLRELVDQKKAALAILECLQNNDPEGAMEMVVIYLDALNKAKLRNETELPKSTMYSALKHGNPTIKTLAKIMYQSTHS